MRTGITTGISQHQHANRFALGQEVERNVRAWKIRLPARLAAAGADLVFWLALDCACSAGDPAVIGLTPEVEQIADAIVESIEVTK
jgi:hypothetical protein